LIKGYVDEDLLPVVDIEVRGKDRLLRQIPALLDTGCSVSLLLPAYLLRRLGLESEGETDIRPVDGNPITVPTCKVTIRWDGEVFEVEAIEIDNDSSFPIVGIQLCQDRKITIEMRTNGEVLVERM